MHGDERWLRERIAAAGLESRTDLLLRLAQPAIRLVSTRADGTALPVGASRLGGLPDLPSGAPWPRTTDGDTRREEWERGRQVPDVPLPFLAQIDFGAVEPHDSEGLLPDSGHLWVFVDLDNAAWRLFYRPSEADALAPASPPADLPAESVYPVYTLTPQSEWTLPDYGLHGAYGGDSPVFFDVLEPDVAAVALADTRDTPEEKRYRDLCGSLSGWPADNKPGPEHSAHRMLGHADYVQNPIKLDLQLAATGRAGDYSVLSDDEDPETVAFKTEAAGWTLLLQIDSVYSDPDMTWGDGGIHYWWIKRDDLLRRDFSRVRYDFQMG